MRPRFIQVKDSTNGTIDVGAKAENIVMEDGTFLSDTLGNIDVMNKGSVAAQIANLNNRQSAPISNPQFQNSIAVMADNEGFNTSFGVAKTNDEWQTKVENRLLVNGNIVLSNGNTTTPKNMTMTAPTVDSSGILNVNNGIQMQVDDTPIFNVTSAGLEMLKDLNLGSQNLSTTGEITASNIVYGGKITNRTQLDAFMNKYNSTEKMYLIRLGYKVAYPLAIGEEWQTGKSTAQGFGFCIIGTNGKGMTIIFNYRKAIYETQIRRGIDFSGQPLSAGYRTALRTYKIAQTQDVQAVVTIPAE